MTKVLPYLLNEQDWTNTVMIEDAWLIQKYREDNIMETDIYVPYGSNGKLRFDHRPFRVNKERTHGIITDVTDIMYGVR